MPLSINLKQRAPRIAIFIVLFFFFILGPVTIPPIRALEECTRKERRAFQSLLTTLVDQCLAAQDLDLSRLDQNVAIPLLNQRLCHTFGQFVPRSDRVFGVAVLEANGDTWSLAISISGSNSEDNVFVVGAEPIDASRERAKVPDAIGRRVTKGGILGDERCLWGFFVVLAGGAVLPTVESICKVRHGCQQDEQEEQGDFHIFLLGGKWERLMRSEKSGKRKKEREG